MNKIFKLFTVLFLMALSFTACMPDDVVMPDVDVKPEELVEGIAFKIEHDAKNPNIVYLKSLMDDSFTPLWNHPQGRSQDKVVTLKIPFAGTYEVQFGVMTRGGVVYGDTVTFEVADMYADFISDPLWTLLTGGVGNEKTWVADNGKYGFAPGALSYADPSSVLEFNNFTPNWEPAGNAVGSTDANMGWGSTMTFGLKGGAVLKTHKLNEGGIDEVGKFSLNVDNHTLTTLDATILRPDNYIANAENWSKDLKVLTLTENQLRVAVMRTNSEGPWWYILNYVSKEHADNYVAVEPEPTLPDGWQNDVSQTVSKTIKWVLSPETPFNWANLDGSLMNADWTSANAYASWTGFNAAAAASYANFSLTLNSDANSAVYVAPDGTTANGTYTLDEKGVFTFNGFKPTFVISGGWVTLSTTSENQWRITKIEKDVSGNVTGMWVGSRDASKPEYMVYKLVPQVGTATADPLAAWKKALVGKTFKPDVNWFIDWINFDFSGGWTSASTFGTDFATNNWVWTQKTRTIAESASIKFEAAGADIMAVFKQDVYDADGNLLETQKTVSGKVVIDPDKATLTFEFPLVDYTGSPGGWLNRDNAKGANYTVALGNHEWLYAAFGGSTLANINTNGFWLATVANATAGGDSKNELLAFHWVLAQ